MTMRITVKNEDHSRSAVVKVIDKDARHDGGPEPVAEITKVDHMVEVKPGETREFWIHGTRFLRVEEV